MDTTIASLSALLSDIRGCSLIHNDRGNGCAGPGREDADDVLQAIEAGERDDVALVAAEDAESWDLAREAFRAHGLNPAGISAVYLAPRQPGDNGHQTIYAI